MTTMELIERGIGHNCLSDAYDLGRADAYEELFKRIYKHFEGHIRNVFGKDEILDEISNLIDEYLIYIRLQEQLKEQNE